MLSGDQRTDVGSRIEWIADHYLLGTAAQPGDELLADSPFDEDPGAVGTHLALGVEVGE